MQKTFTRFLMAALCLLAGTHAARGQTTYTPVTVTGFNTDVVASGTAAVNTTTTYDLDGSDGLGYTFMSPDYRNPTAPGTAPTRPLPASGLVNNRLNTSMNFQLAGYGSTSVNNFNALRLPATGNNAAATGLLTLTTPQQAADLYVLATSGGAASTVALTVNFTDGSSQAIAAQTVGDWFSGTTNIAYQGLGRVSRGSNGIDNASTTTFRLFQLRATIDAANLTKQVESIGFNKTSVLGALNVFAVTVSPPCTGTPTGGTTTAGVSTACSSTSIALALNGASTAPGISYQWQRSTDAGQSWSDIGGATSATYSASGQTTETRYRARLTCGASGLAATSAPVTVAQNPFYNCYCTVVSTGSGEYINSVAVNTLNSVSNANSNGYADYTGNAGLTTILNQGASYVFSLGVRANAGGSQGGLWIDYDHSGTFDAAEYTAIGGSGQIASDIVLTNTLSIPGTALLGTTRMRVRWRNSGIAAANACVTGSSTWFGETEDYLVSLGSSTDCAGTPPATTVSASASSTCPVTGFTLTLAGLPAGASGYSIQWQSRSVGTSSFSPLGTASASPVYAVADQRVATEYRAVVTCTGSGQSTNSAVTTVAQNDFLTCYCTPTQGAGCAIYATINSVNVNTLSSSTGCGGTPYYFLYPASTPANTTTLTIGSSYPLTVNMGRYSKVGVWIDYDHSGTFDASEYTFIGSNSSNTAGSTATAAQSISIPAGALSGETRLRVRSQYFPTASTLDGTTSCNGFSYGETEDYTITLVPELACAGAPPMATATASATTICAGSSFTLSATGIAAGTTGLTYQWQSSPAGAGSFTALGGPQSMPGYTVSGQTATTDYRVIVTCTSSGQSTTSASVTVAQSSFLACHCTPTGGSCTNEWVRGVTLNTLSNTGTTCTSGGYADYTGNSALTTTLTPGTDYQLTLAVRFNAASSQVGAWIDYDHSGTFDASEYTPVGTGPATGFSNLDASYTATISVPAGALGPTRMRVRSNNGALGNGQACLNNYFGEVEDYFISIGSSNDCTGTPPSTTAAASVASVCAGGAVTLSLTGVALGTTGLSYQWQSSPAGAGNFSPLGSVQTSSGYTVPSQTAATDYRVVVTCTNSGLSQTSSIVSVGLDYLSCYCTPTGGSCANEWVRGITLNTLSSNNNACSAGGYANYTSNTALSTTLVQGLTYPLTLAVHVNAASSQAGIWIDYDHSGTFEASEYTLVGTGPATGFSNLNTSFSASLTIPAGALTGPTRLRVRSNNGALAGTQACLNSFFGEVEDYVVTISAPTACTGTPTAGTATSSAGSVCAGTSFTLSVSGLPVGIDGLTYQWESRPAGTSLYDPISGATGTSYLVPGQTAATDYRLVVTCAGSGQSAGSVPVTVGQTAFTDCYCAPSYATGGGGSIIASVELWPLANNTTDAGNPAPYYHDYSTVQTSTTSMLVPVLVPGQTSDVTLKFGSSSSQYSGVWVDFNQNGAFENGEFFTLGSSAGAGGTAVIPVSVPATALLGPTKMRVRGGNSAALLAAESCGASTGSANGEAEDYLVRVSNTPLPVTLTRFTARRAGSAVLLGWATASETPDMTYEVERSLNGRDYQRLATLAGLGRPAEYAYRDQSPAAGQGYYRLRIVETDGSATYSPVAVVTMPAGGLTVAAFPNPATTGLTVQIDGPAAAKASVQLLDLTGKVLQTGRLEQQRATFALDKLPAGVYLVRYRDASHDKTIKVLKQ